MVWGNMMFRPISSKTPWSMGGTYHEPNSLYCPTGQGQVGSSYVSMGNPKKKSNSDLTSGKAATDGESLEEAIAKLTPEHRLPLARAPGRKWKP